jgi:hypothetical protein
MVYQHLVVSKYYIYHAQIFISSLVNYEKLIKTLVTLMFTCLSELGYHYYMHV